MRDTTMHTNERQGLYRQAFEHDSCGIGFVANLKGHKSHEIVSQALGMLGRMEHRGGTGFDIKSGDGAGILIQMPHALFMEACPAARIRLPAFGDYGVAMTFFPQDKELRTACKTIIERNIRTLGLSLLGYRQVPTDNRDLGESARSSEPSVEQLFIARPHDMAQDAFERKLMVMRNFSEHVARQTVKGLGDTFSIVSCSWKTITYKGQLVTGQVPMYYTDLCNPSLESALATVHSRFSTNTFPSWRLAQPFRYIAHNGEINTIRGNINWMRAREELLACSAFTHEELSMLFPICDETASDSANLDMAIEMLVLSGRSLPHVMMMLIPEAWQHHEGMESYKKGFYEYYSAMMEPWDGPASICFTDGVVVGATLDRNGLRPSRYCVTDDDTVIMASESGCIDIDPARIRLRGRLQPGRIFVADLEQGRIIADNEIKADICHRQPYAKWVRQNMTYLDKLPTPAERQKQPDATSLLRRQQAFGYTHEDIEMLLTDTAIHGHEPLGSMGADNPLAILSDRPQQLSHYFKQLFAQVTNPPIDPIREKLIMDMRTYVGGFKNILTESPEHCRRIAIRQPILTNEELEKLRYVDKHHFQTRTIDILFKADGKPGTLAAALDKICRYAEDAISDGYSILLLSDRRLDSTHAPIPSLLATGAIHHHLIRAGKRGMGDIIVEAGDLREVHHFATVLGYGASALNPYLALESISDMRARGLTGDLDETALIANYIRAIDLGLLKIFSKMGISTLASYQGAQIFEILGLGSDVVQRCFAGTVSRIEGLGFDQIATETLARHRRGFPKRAGSPKVLEPGGDYHWRVGGERHLFNPTTIMLLQEATREQDYGKFQAYSQAVNDQSRDAYTLRGLMCFAPDRPPIPIDQVEPAENILKRFASGAMSFGSISWEAHTTLAIALNRIGSKSNSGEGGEDPIRYRKIDTHVKMSDLFPGRVLVDYELKPGDSLCSATKQVASGRFGVSSYYLANARELQIKMAQGAKPGEGGQLPGHKVSGWIARTRNSTPGVGLISPPPHHDIYSIEDLAQLIFDLKNANREARINVKLVSETGVGTVAAGVCKAKADAVLISGYDGGTGASPVSSIKHAGLPWELGLAETHQTLVRNKLRSRIVVQADGQMKTARDLAIATLLGAEEWGVATAALVVQGCIMMRKCHSNTCPVGVATQNGELRAKFQGKPEYVVTLFEFLVQGLREIMAELGFRSIEEMVGQSQCLRFRDQVAHWKYGSVDLSPILFRERIGETDGLYCSKSQNHQIDAVLDWKLLEAARPALENGEPVQGAFPIFNTDRTTGALLSHEISRRFANEGLPTGTIRYTFRGSAGQSFGCFLAPGVDLELEGDANDYLGKGLSGGTLCVYPDRNAPFVAEENIIIGNVCFYGATRGEAYIRGLAGERFCVRNSGARVVVEGVGDHGCEYMTGGCTVILGPTGRNFGAGMSGGVAYVYDPDGNFPGRCNMGMINLYKMEHEADIAELKAMIEQHAARTGSTLATAILADWEQACGRFVKVLPEDYETMLGYIETARRSGRFTSDEQIQDAAFDMHIADWERKQQELPAAVTSRT